MKLNKLVLTIFVLFSQLLNSKALACASCGSGNGDPLILYPNETLKLYVGTRYLDISDHIRADGILAPNYLAANQMFLDLGLGYRLTQNLFANVYSGIQMNQGSQSHKINFQETLFKARLTLWEQDHHYPWLPQVQLLAGYKPNFAKDKYTSADPELLDVFGNGHQEFHLGYDIWNSMYAIIGGISQTLILPLPREIDGAKVYPGIGIGSVATIGVFYSGSNKLILGYSLNLRSRREENDAEIDQSQSRNHAIFVAADYAVNLKTSIRASISFSGLSKSTNTTRTNSFVASINQTLF